MKGYKMNTDYLGNEFEVGDKVVFYELGYRNFHTGKIAKITPKTVVIEHEPTTFGKTKTRQFHHQIIKL